MNNNEDDELVLHGSDEEQQQDGVPRERADASQTSNKSKAQAKPNTKRPKRLDSGQQQLGKFFQYLKGAPPTKEAELSDEPEVEAREENDVQEKDGDVENQPEKKKSKKRETVVEE